VSLESPAPARAPLVNEILARALGRSLHRSRQPAGAHRALEGVEHLDKVIVVDQSPIGRTPRSNPATYTGLFSGIRELFGPDYRGTAAGLPSGSFQL